MTLEECKEIHKEIWDYIAHSYNFIENYTIYNRGKIKLITDLKRNICDKKGFNLKHDCALCQYTSGRTYDCKSCPALWGTEDATDKYYCEYATLEQLEKAKEDGTYLRNWFLSNPEEVKNIKWKDEVE